VGLELAQVEAAVAPAAGPYGEERGEATRVFFEQLDAEQLDVAADGFGGWKGGGQAHRDAPGVGEGADSAVRSYTLESYCNARGKEDLAGVMPRRPCKPITVRVYYAFVTAHSLELVRLRAKREVVANCQRRW
jgi:hypothetical protein